MYILIIAIWFSGGSSGYTVATQEFSTKDKCEVARQTVIEMLKDGHDIKTRCVEK